MDIPDWLVWIALGLTALQVLALVPTVRRLRGPDPAVRSKARLDLVESVGNLLLFGGMILSLMVGDHWLWLAFVGLAVMAAVNAVKGVQWLRARRRPTA